MDGGFTCEGTLRLKETIQHHAHTRRQAVLHVSMSGLVLLTTPATGLGGGEFKDSLTLLELGQVLRMLLSNVGFDVPRLQQVLMADGAVMLQCLLDAW